ncbi:MAG: hypothetical protein HQL31_12885, partial [Planctomycetes bacterium]|nr:hypothetical protein [Planctomycetota bacterium]
CESCAENWALNLRGNLYLFLGALGAHPLPESWTPLDFLEGTYSEDLDDEPMPF